jgi:hypothetical protein
LTRALCLLLALVAGSLAWAANADAATLGSTNAAAAQQADFCSNGYSWVQRATASGSPSYAAPADGVIDSWTTSAGGSGGTAKLKVWRPTANASTFTAVAESAVETVPGGHVLTTFSTSIAVQAGDVIGIASVSGLPECIYFTGAQAGDVAAYTGGDPTSGDAAFTDCLSQGCGGGGTGSRLNLSVTFQPGGAQAPTVTTSTGATSYAENAAATPVDGALTVTDSDSADLQSAQVRISAGFEAGDSLSFTDQSGISGSYDSGTGVLTLTGSASVADYETALQSVSFASTNDNPATSKTVSFEVNDGSLDSNTATKDIAVTRVDDPPRAVDDSAQVPEDPGARRIGVLANDTDVDGGTKAVASVTQPAHGTAAVTNGGAYVSYSPAAGYCNSQAGGTPDTFTYTLNGGSQATVSITVTCADAAPAPHLKIAHPRTKVNKRGALVHLRCRGSVRCTGTLTLKPTHFRSRLHTTALKQAPIAFDIAAGTDKAVRIQVPHKTRTRLHKKHKAVVRVIADLDDGQTLKRLLTVYQH